MSAAFEVPFDNEAERTVIGCCVDSDAGYRQAAEVLEAADFYVPVNQRLFAACGHMTDLVAPDIDTRETRIRTAATLAGVPTEVVRSVVDDRAVQWDRGRGYTARVRAESIRRFRMTAAYELYNACLTGDNVAAMAVLGRLWESETLTRDLLGEVA